MRIKRTGKNVKLWLSANDTYNWAHKAGVCWPCSFLAGKRLFAEFEDGDLIYYAVNGRIARDMQADEFNAITSDYITSTAIKDKVEQKTKCPACGSVNTSTEHLLYEYKEMLKAGFNQMFGHNARKCCNDIVDLLRDRDITSYQSLFGTHTIRKWTY